MLALKLILYRRENNLSQLQLARKCQVSEKYIISVESRRVKMTPKIIHKFYDDLWWTDKELHDLLNWASNGSRTAYQKADKHVIDKGEMNIMQALEERYGNMAKVPGDEPMLHELRRRLGIK